MLFQHQTIDGLPYVLPFRCEGHGFTRYPSNPDRTGLREAGRATTRGSGVQPRIVPARQARQARQRVSASGASDDTFEAVSEVVQADCNVDACAGAHREQYLVAAYLKVQPQRQAMRRHDTRD